MPFSREAASGFGTRPACDGMRILSLGSLPGTAKSADSLVRFQKTLHDQAEGRVPHPAPTAGTHRAPRPAPPAHVRPPPPAAALTRALSPRRCHDLGTFPPQGPVMFSDFPDTQMLLPVSFVFQTCTEPPCASRMLSVGFEALSKAAPPSGFRIRVTAATVTTSTSYARPCEARRSRRRWLCGGGDLCPRPSWDYLTLHLLRKLSGLSILPSPPPTSLSPSHGPSHCPLRVTLSPPDALMSLCSLGCELLRPTNPLAARTVASVSQST